MGIRFRTPAQIEGGGGGGGFVFFKECQGIGCQKNRVRGGECRVSYFKDPAIQGLTLTSREGPEFRPGPQNVSTVAIEDSGFTESRKLAAFGLKAWDKYSREEEYPAVQSTLVPLQSKQTR